MHIEIVDDNAVITSDSGDTLEFEFRTFKTNLIRVKTPIFDDLNGFWSKLSASRRKQIFEIYGRVHTLLDDMFFDSKALHKSLTSETKNLMEHHQLHETQAYVERYMDIKYPDTVKLEMTPEDNMRPEKTYTRAKYDELLALALSLKPMAPIWSMYINFIKKSASDAFVDLVAARLLDSSWIGGSKPRDDLLAYIENNLENVPRNLASVMSGLGSASIPEFLLSTAFIRRLSIKPLTGDPDINLVADVYRLIRYKSDGQALNKMFRGKVKAKTINNDESASDEQTSMLESYKIKEPLSTGERMVFEFYAQNIESIAERLDPDVDKERLMDCWMSARAIVGTRTELFQKRLVQWVLRPVLSPKAIEVFKKTQMINMIAITQCVLWKWGFKEIAALLTCVSNNDTDDMVFNTSRSGRIHKDRVARLVELYPHQRPEVAKSPKTSPGYANEGCRAIDAMAKVMGSHDWKINCPEALLKEVEHMASDNVFVIPADIRTMLADLAIYLAEKRQRF